MRAVGQDRLFGGEEAASPSNGFFFSKTRKKIRLNLYTLEDSYCMCFM